MKVLITGAAGKAGRAVRRELAGRHRLRLLDIVPIEDPEGEYVQGDVCDPEALREAMAGIDAVVHLAFSHGTVAADFDVNVKACYHVGRGACEAGVRKVVYASTLSVYDGHPTLLQRTGVGEDEPPYCQSLYGLTKYLGEVVLQSFSRAHGLAVICLRLTGLKTPQEWDQDRREGRTDVDHCRGATSVADVARAFRRALESDGVDWGVFNICGDNPGRVWDLGKARDVLGFWPEDRFGPAEAAP